MLPPKKVWMLPDTGNDMLGVLGGAVCGRFCDLFYHPAGLGPVKGGKP